MADLTGVWAKLDRADEHLATLDASLGLWRNSDPSSVAAHRNEDKTEHRFYLSLKVQPDLIRWELLIGDCAHNLRSALDHLTWQLAGKWASNRTQFPIFRDRARYFDSGGGVAQIKGVEDPEQRALFEKFQPWTNPIGADKDALWLIHEFDRVDKHQVVQPVLFVPRDVGTNLVIEYASEELARLSGPPLVEFYNGPLKDGAEFLTLNFAHPPVKVKMKADFTLGIAIEYAGTRGGVTGTLGELGKHARRIAVEFRDVLF